MRSLSNITKTTNPDLELGQSFDTSILNSITRKNVDSSLEAESGTYRQIFLSKGSN